MRILTNTLIVALSLAQSISAAQSAGPIKPADLMRHVAVLAHDSLEGRAFGTPGNAKARAYLVRAFADAGLRPVGASLEHPFTSTSTRDTVVRRGVNVVGMIRGRTNPDRYIVVTAHYDHVGVRQGEVFNGADDNASGTAALIEVARQFRATPPANSMIFVAFDGEESGLRGARAFVAAPPVPAASIVMNVNMDMMGRNEKNELYAAGTSHYPFLKPYLDSTATRSTIRLLLGHDDPNGPARDNWTTQSDHGAFHAAKIPFIYFGVEDHPDYHKPTDTAGRIPRAFYAAATGLVLDTVRRLVDGAGAGSAAGKAALRGRLDSEERAIVAAVDAGNPAALALLERVVNINSGSMNFAGVRNVGQVFRGELESVGFTTRWIDGAPFKRAGHLVAERKGSGPRVLLIGHLDTVFEPDSPFQRFERIDDKTARGPGIIDMKGGDVVMVHALKALHSVGMLDRLNLSIVLTGDEELSGEPLSVAREALVAAAQGADIALGFENGPGNPRTAVIARRGTTGWLVRVKAKPAHSSQVFREDIGYGAIYEAARILDTFREKLAGEQHLTFNPGVILGGTSADLDREQARGAAFGKENVIAEHAVVMGDIRTLSADQLASVKQRMRDIVAASLPHAHATIEFDDGYPALAPTDGNRRLLALYDQASQDVGAGTVTAVNPDRAGAADVSFVAGHVPMILDGIGLMGHSDHTPQETADLTTLPSQTKRAAILLYRLAKGAR